ncbi:MAG: hypothetical protein A2252_08950 [Elusimicrobia bacterium RIFOXYA2_FULL_39_19]|nr:MAG: hypothetical protein A2252_08950 [Elusimicrobia bacterium RIFOXYA2_FULL_39_19]
MKRNPKYYILSFTVFLLILTGAIVFKLDKNISIFSQDVNTSTSTEQQTGDTVSVPGKLLEKPKHVRGIHIMAWSAGSKKYRQKLQTYIDSSTLNTVVIAVKETNGEVYIPGVKSAVEIKAYVPAMPNIQSYISDLKSQNIYTSARIVVFKDNIAARKHPDWAVKNPDGSIWVDKKDQAWLDPFNKDNWEYTFEIAQQCVKLGFEEIQFDYIRFPSDGVIKNCRYSQPHSSTTAVNNIVAFLKEAKTRLKITGVKISIDVFGLTTSSEHDMGIGQSIVPMAKEVDYVCPMVYPSHYPKGSYGIASPNSQPYKTILIALEHARRKMGEDAVKLRPYLQDFSLGYKYDTEEVIAQMQACYDNDIFEWTLWNPSSRYNIVPLKEKEAINKRKLSKNNAVAVSSSADKAE